MMNLRAAIAIAEGRRANAGREAARLEQGGAARGAGETGSRGLAERWR